MDYRIPPDFSKVKDKITQLQSSKLILPRFMFKEKDIDKIDKYYEYQYQLFDLQEYENVILNKKTGNLYMKIIWSRQHKLYLWVVVDAVDGAILSINSFGGMQFGSQQTAKEVIYATSKLAQKINNRHGWKF